MTATTIQRLLSYPHAAVFEKGAEDELAFRVSHPSLAEWTVADGVMTVDAGDIHRSYRLSNMTVIGLINALRGDGFDVVHVTNRFDGLLALSITEGRGRQDESNGDHVKVFTSLMWVLFSAYAQELNAAEYQIRQALLQMVIGTAEGEWLDLWGSLYSVMRLQSETDAAYRIRIPLEAFRLRVNALAIELAILELTGKDVRILEPWVDVFTLDQSILDGEHKLQDDSRVGYFFIQPFSSKPIDWSDVLPIIERNRPAGVLMLPPQIKYSAGVDASLDVQIGTSINRLHTASAHLEDLALLDYALIEDTAVLNHPFLHRRTIVHKTGVAIGSAAWTEHPWTDLPWGDVVYLVSTKYWRSYRLYKMGFTYESQTWQPKPWTDVVWADVNVLIGAGHSRAS